MSPKKKKYDQSAALSAGRVGNGDSVGGSLRTLINGLFGAKKGYQPTRREIAEYFLTPREREIAYLAALGFSVQEIADALGMNFQTVRQHERNILNKLKLNDPRELREFFNDRSDREL